MVLSSGGRDQLAGMIVAGWLETSYDMCNRLRYSMQKKLTITMDEEMYEELFAVIGAPHIKSIHRNFNPPTCRQT